MNKKDPFYYNFKKHFYLASKCILSKHKRILDIGCGNGEFIGNISRKGRSLFGYDVDGKVVNLAKKKYPHVNFIKGEVGKKMPFKNNSFDLVFALHVLEHVDSEKNMIKEISRVLKRNGALILASPYKGVFSWADTANVRYRFPQLHKWVVVSVKGKKKYEERYVCSKERQMVYDISMKRSWHKHYKEREVVELLKYDFIINKFFKYALFLPFLLTLHNVYFLLFKKRCKIIDRMVWLDNNFRFGNLSYNFLVVATKR